MSRHLVNVLDTVAQHTLGRLEVLDGRRISVTLPNEIGGGFDSHCVAIMHNSNGQLDADANARRLVACWNALIGAPTELLELHDAKFTFPDLPYRDLLAQRDELLAALDWISSNGPDDAWQLRECARAAIAKVKGGAA